MVVWCYDVAQERGERVEDGGAVESYIFVRGRERGEAVGGREGVELGEGGLDGKGKGVWGRGGRT